MKNMTFFSILVCFSLMLTTVSCDKSTDQSQTQSNSQNCPVTVRTILDECSDCPVGCCCCGIELISPLSAKLQFCGLCEGDYLCGTYSPDPPCSSISGIGKEINLTSLHPREVFCVEPGASFRIFNAGTGPATFKFTCQYDVTPNTFTTVTIAAGDERFFHNDGSCITAECH